MEKSSNNKLITQSTLLENSASFLLFIDRSDIFVFSIF